MDEMKLHLGLVWNSSNDTLCGYVDEDLGFDDLLADMEFDGKEAKQRPPPKPAMYVNQWMFVTTSSFKFLCEYWFNAGSLKGRQLREQFHHVLRMVEMVGFFCHGVFLDAGGNNHRFVRLVREVHRKAKCEDLWLGEDFISCAHPWDDNRRIYFVFCSAHGLKNVRCQLYMDGKVRYIQTLYTIFSR